jgi:DNA-binding transcriptional MerR regulator
MYTTGEIAKLCGVSVRTVQYYDTRSILVPSALSEGGRRLYSEDDLHRMKIICFLRDTGLSINSIGEFLNDPDPARTLSLLLEEQEAVLREEIEEREKQLFIVDSVRKELKRIDDFSVESIGDIAKVMENKKNLRRIRTITLVTGIPVTLFQWISVILWAGMGIWWPFVAYVLVAASYGTLISKFYFKRVSYICPQCHRVFRPRLKEAFWANHTPTMRKLHCTECGFHGFCVEIYRKEIKENE